MESYNDIRNALQQFAKGKPATLLGTVRDVDSDSRTCTIDDDGVEYYNVALQCITGNETGILVVPAIGAQALALRIEDSDTFAVVAVSEVHSCRIDIGGRSIEIDGNEVRFNDGSVGATRTDKLTEKLNAVENRLNTLLSTLSGIVVPAQGGLVFAPIFAGISPITPTSQSEIEDTKVKH